MQNKTPVNIFGNGKKKKRKKVDKKNWGNKKCYGTIKWVSNKNGTGSTTKLACNLSTSLCIDW